MHVYMTCLMLFKCCLMLDFTDIIRVNVMLAIATLNTRELYKYVYYGLLMQRIRFVDMFTNIFQYKFIIL